MIDTTRKKINNLPPEILAILTAEHAAELGIQIADRYNLNQDQVAMMVELIQKIYIKDLRLADFYPQIKTLFGFDETTARQFACDVAGFRLLPVSDWLGEDVGNFIRSLGGDLAGYVFENATLKEAAAKELAADELANQEAPELPPLELDDDKMNLFPDDPEYQKRITGEDQDDDPDETAEEPSVENLIEEYKKILTENLKDLLTTTDHLFIGEFNYRLIGVLVEHPELKPELVDILLNSQLKIGSETIVLDGRQVAPTAQNWLRYFIIQKGSQMFDAVVLSEFLVNATNAKFLSASDKEILSRLLQLYRNLKFFPDSLIGDDPEQWEILDFAGDPNYTYLDSHQIGSGMTESDEVAEVENETSAPTIDPIKLQSLKILSAKYPVGSLERLAVDEEIKRLTSL